MTSRLWRAAALLAPASFATVALATPAMASTAAASPSWQLTDQYTSRPACFTTGGGSEYLELNLSGTWSPLTFGASGLPAGGSYSDYILYFASATGIVTSAGTAPIPAGSSNGSRISCSAPFVLFASHTEYRTSRVSLCRPARAE